MRVIDIDKFVSARREILNGKVKFVSAETEDEFDLFKRGALSVLYALEHDKNIMEASEVPEIKYPKGCHEEDIRCDDCEHHRSIQWCNIALPHNNDIDISYESGFIDGCDFAEKHDPAYDSGVADGYDEGYKDAIEEMINQKNVENKLP